MRPAPTSDDASPLARCVTASLLVVASIVLVATPVSAHPFGPPLTAELTTSEDTVVVRWAAAEDDWVTLGRAVGAFDEQLPDDDGGPGEQVTRADDGQVTGLERLRRSRSVQAYLLDHVAIRQGGAPCTGRVTDTDDLLGRGAELTFRCRTTVSDVDVRITALTDLHEAYRTVATAGGTRQLYTRAAPVHRWDLAGAVGGTSPVSGAAVVIVVIAAGIVALASSRAPAGRRGGRDVTDAAERHEEPSTCR